MTPNDPLGAAIQRVEQLAEQDSGAHTVMRGLEKKGGKYTGRECVVVLVEEKKPENELQYCFPRAVEVNGGGEIVRVDVQQAAPFRIQILALRESWQPRFNPTALAHQYCFSPLVPGGVQIAPAGANWVGTLGAPWRRRDANGVERFGFITNRHVAGLDFDAGHPMCQPHPQSDPIGVMVWSNPLNTVDPNQLDLSLFDSFIGGRHRIRPEVFSLRGTIPGVADLQLGDGVTKSGRTTGVTTGMVIGLDARTTVNYGAHGNLRFTGQVVIEGKGGAAFSEAGDSGSGVFKFAGLGQLQFAALLFAGGGGKTLANPGRLVVQSIGGEPFIQ